MEKDNIINKYINKDLVNKPSFEANKKQFDGLYKYKNKEEPKKSLYDEYKPYTHGSNQ